MIRSLLLAVLPALAAQSPTLSHKSVVCAQDLTQAAEVVSGHAAVFTTETIFSTWAPIGPFYGLVTPTIGWAVLTVGDQGCSTAFPFGPSCSASGYPMGPLLGDSNLIALEPLTQVWFSLYWRHTTAMPLLALAAGPISWTVQHVWFQWYPLPGACWFAAGNAIRFEASL